MYAGGGTNDDADDGATLDTDVRVAVLATGVASALFGLGSYVKGAAGFSFGTTGCCCAGAACCAPGFTVPHTAQECASGVFTYVHARHGYHDAHAKSRQQHNDVNE